MTALRLLPAILALWVLGAHFMRMGMLPLTAVLVVLPLLFFLRRWWVLRLMQVVLVLGGMEWVRTGLGLVTFRMDHGAPWVRLALIMGGVSFWTLGSALLFERSVVRERYGERER